jgi:hypothetical protein
MVLERTASHLRRGEFPHAAEADGGPVGQGMVEEGGGDQEGAQGGAGAGEAGHHRALTGHH